MWFLWVYFRAGRRWLAFAVCGSRVLVLVINFSLTENINFKEITSVRQVALFGGESASAAVGVLNPWHGIAQLSNLLFLLFIVDVSITLWRRGGQTERRRAAVVGSSLVFFALVTGNYAVLVFAGKVTPFFVVLPFSSAMEFLARPELDVPGCVLVDLQMPGLSGLDLQKALMKAGDPLPVIFLSGHGDIPTTVQVMRGGAEDFLTKTAPKEELIEAVKRALSRDAGERCERARSAALRESFAKLTPRELEVLSHLVRGRLNKQIAYDLGIHERTVVNIMVRN